MKTNEKLLLKVTRILSNWQGSDDGDKAAPMTIAEEIDAAYEDYVASLPAQNLAIRAGQDEWERRAA